MTFSFVVFLREVLVQGENGGAIVLRITVLIEVVVAPKCGRGPVCVCVGGGVLQSQEPGIQVGIVIYPLTVEGCTSPERGQEGVLVGRVAGRSAWESGVAWTLSEARGQCLGGGARAVRL